MSGEYKWPTPHAWLNDQLEKMNRPQLDELVMTLAAEADGDFIQDLFQKEMAADGYFEKLPSADEIRQANRDAHEQDFPEDARARKFDGGF